MSMTPQELEDRRNRASVARASIRAAEEKRARIEEEMLPLRKAEEAAIIERLAAENDLARALCPFEIGEVVPLSRRCRGADLGRIIDILPDDPARCYDRPYFLRVLPIKKNLELMADAAPSFCFDIKKIEEKCGKTRIEE
jgi:hypothetical protein